MRSSRQFASSPLELPPVTVVDRGSAVLMLMAGAFLAWEFARQGQIVAAAGAGALAAVAAGWMRRSWQIASRSRLQAMALRRLGDGRLQVVVAGVSAVAATIGAGTRLLGPSVFLELHFAFAGGRVRYRKWLTPLDVPAEVLRHWIVVLPHGGWAARS